MATTLTAASSSRKAMDFALPLCIAAMDGCWIYVAAWFFWAAALEGIHGSPLPSPLVLAALELAAWGLSLLLIDRTNLPIGSVRVLSGVVGLVAALLVALFTDPNSVLFTQSSVLSWLGTSTYPIIICLTIWFLGGYRAGERPGFNVAYLNFRVGLIGMTASVILFSLLASQFVTPLLPGLGSSPLWFFGWSLAALVLGNREIVREETGTLETGFWNIAAIVSIGAVMFVGILSGVLGGTGLLDIVQNIVVGVIAGVVAVFYGLMAVLVWLLSLFGIQLVPNHDEVPQAPVTQNSTKDLTEQLRERTKDIPMSASIPPEIQNLIIWTAIAVVAISVIGLIAWAITRGVKRSPRRVTRDVSEERFSLGAWAHLLQQVKAFLDRLFGRLRPATSGSVELSEDDLTTLQGRPEWQGTLSVRQIYARMQASATRFGYPRAPQQTPWEYLRVLSSGMPDLRGDLEQITSAYVQARYGPLPTSALTVQATNNAWRKVEQVLRPSAR